MTVFYFFFVDNQVIHIMPRRKSSRQTWRHSSRRRRSNGSARTHRHRGSYRGGSRNSLVPLSGDHHFHGASGWGKPPLPPIQRQKTLLDRTGSVDYIFSRKGSGQFHYPSRESKYTPWEKIKYMFVRDKRSWPPVFDYPVYQTNRM